MELHYSDRDRRLIRAFDLSSKKKELPKEHQHGNPYEVSVLRRQVFKTDLK